MRTSTRLLMLAGALVCAGSANADNGCGAGYTPMLQPSPLGGSVVQCVPTGEGSQQPQQQAAPPQEAIVRERWQVWEDRFGAIATDGLGHYGVSAGGSSRAEAEQVAIRGCEERGGHSCVSRNWGANGCITFAWGGGRSVFFAGKEQTDSELGALKQCEQESGGKCDVIETVCSPAVSYWSDTKPANFVPAE